MPETKINSCTETVTAEETAKCVETEEGIEPRMSGGKRALVWVLLILGSWALVLCIGYPIYKGLKRAIPAATAVIVSDGGRTVTVPAVRGVNATDCQPGELVVEGNRLVFLNGCAKAVFHGQE